jgi:DEAD/DEAH box helicase domain-containing protein
MIPGIVSAELRETILDYLDTTFSFQDARVAQALDAFLRDPVQGIFKGPYLNLRLPYRRGETIEADRLLDVRPPFRSFVHQILAFERLTSKGGHQPQHTIVTTGTGSGKTECFLYPLLDHCAREAGKPGIKAVVLYPMNALASDQARRFAKEIWADERLKGRVTAGMYVGGHGDDRTMGPENVITDRDTLRNHPPDILMTNYKMLDYLMIRPEDQRIWKDTGPGSVQYLVLDELHTYDGAQGSDVACLIRRFKARLRTEPGSLCCVGTSATLAGDEAKATADLVDFASKLFGEAIPRTGVVREDRVNMAEYLGDEEAHSGFPELPAADLLPNDDDGIPEYIDRQCGLWFGKRGLSPLEVGAELQRHAFLRAVLMSLENQITAWGTLVERIAEWDPDFKALPVETQNALLQSFLSLISFAKRDFDGFVGPFIQCQVQLWVREMSRLVRRIAPAPSFFWRDDVPLRDPRKGLPSVYCRECGHTGWVAFKRTQDTRVTDDTKAIYSEYSDGGKNIWYLFPGTNPALLANAQEYLCPRCLGLGNDATCGGCGVEGIAVHRFQHLSDRSNKDMKRCPACETDHALYLVGSQAASLSSVAISHLYTSRFNNDRKLLAFTDSVQDASHRSGFFAARTYRFNLRTAIQTVIENEPSGRIRLDEFADRMIAYWTQHMTQQEMVATFLPPDLAGLGEYRQFIKSRSGHVGKKLMDKFRTRLSWEIAMEYGFNARVGRTLDKVRCSTAAPDPERIESALERLRLVLSNEVALLERVPVGQFRRFVLGLLTRTKTRGGVSHPLLAKYAANAGKWYFLTQKMAPLLSPFSSQSRLPRFLSAVAGEKVFDSAVANSNHNTWYVDWARRTLNPNLDNATCNEVYRRTLEVLEATALLERIGKDNTSAYSIPLNALIVTRLTAQIRSVDDGHYLTVSVDALPVWAGMSSLSFRGTDVYRQDPAADHSYYRSFYQSGLVKRIFCHEHTGILDRETREDVEHQFKSGDLADAPNLLTCTPTLEMGIDVGDLSSVMVCSIPPTPTNYLQRIGRGGRKTGNALILAMANVKPHDLYFFEDPFEMIAGSVIPPGCFLDAPEMLKRQFLAYCMDSWCRDDPKADRMPKNVQFLLAQNRRGEYPQTFIAYAKARRQALSDEFLGLFNGVLSPGNQERLREYALTDGYARDLNECLARAEEEIERIRGQYRRVKTACERVERDRLTIPDADEQISELEYEMKLLRRLIDLVSKKYPLNLFTDEGLIPNYAFPESGVKLKSLIYGVESDGGEKASEPHEYVRGAGTAIRELAPFNTFYAEARKVTIDQVDTGGRAHSQLEDWQFCNTCHNVALVVQGSERKTCSHCGSTGWEDVGQKRVMLELRQVSARTSDFESRTSDDTDDREIQTYILKDFIEIRPENWGGGHANKSLPFGFEYLKQVTLREVNFGPRDLLSKTFMAAGESIPEDGFSLCRDCGVVWRKGNQTPPRHRYWCYYDQGDRPAEWVRTFLYRHVQSEAIRILLPVSILEVDTRLATFKACLELGLRRKFKGNPGHLIIREQEDPGHGGDAAPRNFLVLYDTVPGGTGYLKEFVNNPDEFRNLLEEAFKTLKSCGCRQREGTDGCYRCLYAYQHQYELANVSRELGIRMLEGILGAWDELRPVQTLTDIDLSEDFIESELEGRFLLSLGKAFAAPEHEWSKVLRNGKGCHKFAVGGRTWILEPQVLLTETDGVSAPSKPDFVLWPSGDDVGVLPVAVFADGFAYHVSPDDPHGRISDDIEKRMSILRSRRFFVWSVTWDDVDEFDKETKVDGANIFGDFAPRRDRIRSVLAKAECVFNESLTSEGSISCLIGYLRNPHRTNWGKGIAATILASSMPVPPFFDLKEVRLVEQRLSGEQVPAPVSLVPRGSDGDCLARLHHKLPLSVLIHAGRAESNQFDWETFQAIIRIEDDLQNRKAVDYKSDWRKQLATANLLQFIPDFSWLSSGLVARQANAQADAKQSGASTDEAETNDLAELLELCDASCHPLIKRCVNSGGLLPIVGYELQGENQRVCAEAELAWTAANVAVLIGDQESFRSVFQSHGWTVFSLQEAEGDFSTFLGKTTGD